MLRVVVVQGGENAKGYYRAGDYYAAGEELPGEWGGEGAARLGLVGAVGRAAFERLCDNCEPATGHRLTARTKGNRRVAYDFNFHVPKSLSVVYGLSPPPEILDAFRRAVDETLREIERDARARVRAGGRLDERVTGNLVWAAFVHTTARPVGGTPDPHLHLHAVVFNATFDSAEGRWKAVELGEVKRNAPYFEAAFHARLAGRLRSLGYDVVRTDKGWEVAGVPGRVVREFSRRALQVERVAAARGVTDAKVKDSLGALTRERKRRALSAEELGALWRSRLTADERRAVALVRAKALDLAPPAPHADRDAVLYAVGHLFERHSVVPVYSLLAAALRRGVGGVTVDGVRRELDAAGLIFRETDGTRYATSRAVLAEEAGMLAFARGGRGACPPLGRADRPFTCGWLSDEQKAAVRHVLGSPDRVILVRGGAGTGKTALMKEAAEAIGECGRHVVALAPSADASRGVLRGEGFASADTVARFLIDERLQAAARGQVVWVDEAALLGTRTLAALFGLASKLGARVILSGDRRQHAPVERGDAVRLLEAEAGLVPARLAEIRRQAGRYREAVRLLGELRTLDGFDVLDGLGWVREVADGREALLAADYVRAVAERKTVLVVSPTHAEGRRVTAAVRTALRAAGLLAATEHVFVRYESRDLTAAERGDPVRFRPGDVVEFHQHAPGFRSGTRWTVVDVGRSSVVVRDAGGRDATLPLGLAGRFRVYRPHEIALAAGDRIRVTKNGRSADGRRLDNGAVYTVRGFTPAGDVRVDAGAVIGRDFGHVAYGYCVTSHASQGKTVDRVLIAQGSESFPASSRAQFYVSVSRGRERATVYTDDKGELRRAVGRSAPRPSATELVGPAAAESWRAWALRRVPVVGRLATAAWGPEPGREREPERTRGVGR